jgi:hypothetical protein
VFNKANKNKISSECGVGGREKEVGIGVHMETLDLKYQGTTHLAGYSQVRKIAIKCILYKMVVMMSLLQRYLLTLI